MAKPDGPARRPPRDAPPSALERWHQRLRSPAAIHGALGIAGALLLWEAILALGWVDRKLMPTPRTVFAAGLSMAKSGELFVHIGASVARAVTGLVVGSGIGIVFGLLTGRITLFAQLLEPLAQLFRAIPAIAFVPLAIIWFGLGEQSKIFLIIFGVFFPVWINTLMGVKNVRPVYVRAARSLGATQQQLLRRVILPAALPFIITGVRISVAIAYIMLAAAEMAGAQRGLGQMIQESYLVFRTDRMIVGIVMLGVLGLVSDRLFMAGVRRLFPWYGAERE